MGIFDQGVARNRSREEVKKGGGVCTGRVRQRSTLAPLRHFMYHQWPQRLRCWIWPELRARSN